MDNTSYVYYTVNQDTHQLSIHVTYNQTIIIEHVGNQPELCTLIITLAPSIQATLLLLGMVQDAINLDCSINCSQDSIIDCYGLYVGTGTQTITVKTKQNHYQKNATSNVLIKTLGFNQAQINIEGIIYIASSAPLSITQFYNKNMLLHAQARAISKPMLSVHNKNVQCKHGSAVGYFDLQVLNYLQMRGFTPQQAHAFIINAFIADIINIIPHTISSSYKAAIDQLL